MPGRTIHCMAGVGGERQVRRYGLCIRLDPTDVQAGWFAQSAGARRWCFNQAVALIKANSEQWQAQRSADVEPGERVKPLSAMDLRNALKRDRPEWLLQLSVWVLEFAAVDAAEAAKGFSRVGLDSRSSPGRARPASGGPSGASSAVWRLELCGCPRSARSALRRRTRPRRNSAG